MKTALLFLALRAFLVPTAATGQCCDKDYYILMGTDLCWEPKSNKTTPVNLSCGPVIKIGRGVSVTAEGMLAWQIPGEKEPVLYEPEIFCMGNVTNTSLSFTKQIAVLCTGEEEQILNDTILGSCMIVSVIFLGITSIIYMALSEIRDLQGKTIASFTTSLAIALAILAIMKMMEYTDMSLCATRGFLAYFFTIASFFWTNAISIQLVLSIRRPSSVITHSWKEYMYYSLYAWTCPTILTVCMAIVNYYPGEHERPGIGLTHCWFLTTRLQWIYMYSVMTILLAVNIGIFIYTSTVLWRHTFSSTHIKAVKYKLTMTVRLIILMGLPWIFEMIGSLCEKHIIWTILDVFNTLQGVLIFLLLVVFRRRVLKAMYKRGWLNCIAGPIEKYLAVNDDDEDNPFQRTEVMPMAQNGTT